MKDWDLAKGTLKSMWPEHMNYWPRLRSRWAVCWPSFFVFLWTEMKLNSIKTQKRMGPISSHLDQRTSLVNKGFIDLKQHQLIQHSLCCLKQFLHKMTKPWNTKKRFFTNRCKTLKWGTMFFERTAETFIQKRNSKCATEYFQRCRFIHWYTLYTRSLIFDDKILSNKIMNWQQLFPINFIYCKSLMYCKFFPPLHNLAGLYYI